MYRNTFARLGSIAFVGLLAATPSPGADWPQWGGARRDFSVDVKTEIAAWKAGGPPVVWRRDLGPGFGAVVAAEDRLITMYRRDDMEVVAAFATADGKLLWEHPYSAPARPAPSTLDTSYGAGPNGTPLIVEDHVYTLGFTGVVNCVRLRDGRPVWSQDLAQQGVQPPYFGHASSPLRYRDTVIVAAGGARAFDLETGEQRWANTSFAASYASPILVERETGPLLLLAAAGVVVGLNPDDGNTSWREDHVNDHRTILSSPVPGPDDWILVSAYYIGSIGLQLSADGSVATRRWENSQFQLSHSNSIRYGDLAIGFHNSFLTAIDVKTGEIAWRHRGMRKSNLLKIGSRLLLLGGLGRLTLAEPSPDGIDILATAQVFEGRAWTAPTFIDGTLYVRTEDTLMALDLTGKRSVPTPSVAAAPQPISLPEGFANAQRGLNAALYTGDAAELAASRAAFESWTETSGVAHLARYYVGVATWRQMLAAEKSAALALLDEAVEQANGAIQLQRDFADAHALLSRLYPMYYRLDPRRAAVIATQGDEHLGLALIHGPDNPRVIAAAASDLLNSPADYGGDRVAGLERIRQALALFADAQADPPAPGIPRWGHALTWAEYGRALLQDNDRDGARDAFQQALTLQPTFDAAHRQLAALAE